MLGCRGLSGSNLLQKWLPVLVVLPKLSREAPLQATKMLNEEISSLVGGLRSSSNSSLSAFARMEQKVEALEAEAEAAGQLGVRPVLPHAASFNAWVPPQSTLIRLLAVSLCDQRAEGGGAGSRDRSCWTSGGKPCSDLELTDSQQRNTPPLFSPLSVFLRMEEKMGPLQAEAWVPIMMLQQQLLYGMRPAAAWLRACFPSPLGQTAQA